MSTFNQQTNHQPNQNQAEPAANKIKLGPNGKPIRPFVMPKSFWEKLKVWRYMIYRRILQLGILLLFLVQLTGVGRYLINLFYAAI